MARVPIIKDGDWSGVRQAIQKLDRKLGYEAIPIFTGLTLTGLTASRLISTDADKLLSSVTDLTSWIAGTANQITVADDSDGTVTLATPQDIHTAAYPVFINTNTALSSMIMTGGAISVGTNVGTIKVAALTAMLRTGSGATDPLTRITLAEQDNIILAAVDTFYNVLLTYGDPCTIATSTGGGNGANIIGIGHCLKETDGTRHYSDAGLRLSDGVRKLHRRASKLRKIEKSSGCLVSDPATRNLYIAAGYFHRGINQYIFTLKDTSASDTFDYYYYNPTSAAWVKDDNSGNHYTQIDKLQYNEVGSGTGLANITVNKYTTNWVFVHPDDEDIIVVYGRVNGTLTAAENEGIPPSLPDVINDMAGLLAKIIIQQGSDTLIIQNVEYFTFTQDITVDHNELTGLQGGAANEYYHLTSAEHTLISDVGGLTPTDSNFIVGNGSTWVVESGATARTSLGLGSIATYAGSQNLRSIDSPTFITGTFTDLVVDTHLIKTVSVTNCVGINIVATPTHALEVSGEVLITGSDGGIGSNAPTAFEVVGGTGDAFRDGGSSFIRGGTGGVGAVASAAGDGGLVGLYGGDGGVGSVDEISGNGGYIILNPGSKGDDGGGGFGVDGVIDIQGDIDLNTNTLLVPSGGTIAVTGTLKFDFASDNWEFVERTGATLGIQNTTSGRNMSFEFFTADGNGDDYVGFNIWAFGTIGQTINRELLFVRFNSPGDFYEVFSSAAGTGTVRPIKFYTGVNTDQLVIATDGKVGIGLVSPKTKLTIEGALTLKEQVAADGDSADYGQIWVKTASPNELWFTDDGGTDHQIAFV